MMVSATAISSSASLLAILSFLISPLNAVSLESEAPHRRHDYKFTFKPPFLHNNSVPFFTTYSHAIPSPDFLRLSPSVHGADGSIWANEPNPHKEWEVEMQFAMFGHGTIGSDGLAFWYAKEKLRWGPVFGSMDAWEGLLVAFDTYDKNGQRTNPMVMGYLNDGSMKLSEMEDPAHAMFDGCFRAFRNTPGSVWARISYYDETLKVAVDTTRFKEDVEQKGYLECFRAEGIKLPTGYYFGVTASTGYTPDDHDVFSFDLYEVNSKEHRSGRDAPKLTRKEQEKIDAAEKKVRDARHKKDRSNGGSSAISALTEDESRAIKHIKEQQFKMQQTLDDLHVALKARSVRTEEVLSHAGGISQAHLEGIDDTQSLIRQLRNELHDLAGEHGLKAELNRLHDAVTQLQHKLDDFHLSSYSLHDETRQSIHQKTEEAHSSMFRYLVFFVVLQLVVYVVWTLWRASGSRNSSKFM